MQADSRWFFRRQNREIADRDAEKPCILFSETDGRYGMKKCSTVYKVILCAVLLRAAVHAIPAFPGAEGGGAGSVGGRGGRVIEVTNCNDTGEGSLREACGAQGPRTVVFRTGGIIATRSAIHITHPYLTIAGQTAPGGGITLHGLESSRQPLSAATHDIIIRCIRVRTGRGDQSGQGGDAIALTSNCNRIVIDHCSVSWSNDENVSIWADNGVSKNVTFSWNIVSEGLNFDHPGCGLIVGSNVNSADMENISVVKNLFAHNYNRNPLLKCSNGHIINNIIYNWEWWATGIGGGITVDIIGNVYKKGNDSGNRSEMIHRPNTSGDANIGPAGNPSIYLKNNIGPHNSDPDADNWNTMLEQSSSSHWGWPGNPPTRTRVPRNCERSNPMPAGDYPIHTYDVRQLDSILLAGIGASYRLDENGRKVVNRDTIDKRVIREYLDGTGTCPTDENEVGGFSAIDPGTPYDDTDHDGMPDTWENTHGFDPSNEADRNDDPDSDGYTNLEEFLNGTNPRTDPVAVSQAVSLPARIMNHSSGGSKQGILYNLDGTRCCHESSLHGFTGPAGVYIVVFGEGPICVKRVFSR